MITLALAGTAVVGWLLLPRRLGAGLVEGLALGFALGAFGVSVQMFFYDLAGVGWNYWGVALPWLALAGWKLSRERPALNGSLLEPAQWIAVAATAVALLLWLPFERSLPLTSQSWDAWAIWLFKAKAFYIDGEIGAFLARSGEFVGQPGYPLLVPLYGTFLYLVQGAVADHAAKLMTPCFFVAMLATLHYLVRRASGPSAAGCVTAMLALTPMVNRVAFDLAGYADTPLSLYLLAAAGFLYLWLRDGDDLDLAAAGLAATAAGWTKNEGQLFLAAVAAMGLTVLIRERRLGARAAWLVAPPAVLLGAWAWMRSAQQVEAAGFILASSFHGDLFAIAARSMFAKALTLSSYSLAFVALPTVVAGGAALRAGRSFWALPILIGLQLGGVLLAYATGRNEIHWWLETSADRLLTQTVPLILLAVGVLFGLWREAAQSPAAAPAVTGAGSRRKRRSK